MLYCDYSTLPTQTRQKLRDYLCWLFHPLKASLLTYARKRLGKKTSQVGRTHERVRVHAVLN